MPPVRLLTKIIKDATLDAGDGAQATAPRLEVLRLALLPFNVYVRLQVPMTIDHVSDDHPHDFLSLQIVGQSAANGAKNDFFGFSNLPPRVMPISPRPQVRKMLVLLSWPEAQPGRYRVVLVRDGTHVDYVDIEKDEHDIRVLDAPPPEAVLPVTPLVISGTPKSGTTWLEKVVNAHSDILVLHEANTLNMLDFNALRRQLEMQREGYRTRNYISWMVPHYDSEEFARFLQINLAKELMARMARAWGASYVADRTPGYAALYPYLPRFWDDLRVLHIVRHPLDVMASWLFHEANAARNPKNDTILPRDILETLNKRLDDGETVAPGTFVPPDLIEQGIFKEFTGRWCAEQNLTLTAVGRYPSQFHLIRYEDLSEQFRDTAAGIFAFLGIDPARTNLDLIELNTSFQALSGGRVAGEMNARSFFRKGIVGDWRNIFSASQADALWTAVAGVASAFQYTRD